MDWKKRLKSIRGKRSQENFGKEYGFNQHTYPKLEISGKLINPDFLISLNQKENINLNWLITGNGHQYNNNEFQINESQANYNHPQSQLIGKINSTESVIQFYNTKKEIENIGTIENFTNVHLANISKNIILLEIEGNTLLPKFHDHDILMIDKSINLSNIAKNVYGIFSVQKDNWIFRRYNTQNGFCLLEPLNSEINTIAIDPSDLNIYGIAIHLFRSLH